MKPTTALFLRFYKTTDVLIDECLAALRSMGHTFTETRKPITVSMNVTIPENSIQVDLTFPSTKALAAFMKDERTRATYMEFATPSNMKGTFTHRKPGDPAFRV